MNAKMLAEINEIPVKAMEFLNQSPTYTLPHGVPYLGMGSSFFCPIGIQIYGSGYSARDGFGIFQLSATKD
ncbi:MULTISPECIES: hypothetical protein [Flavobacterium]|uniref:Uncharacterized protein n=1 Tax=Flavobacterium circumlabens TaxID=2133765 RepID=A0ABY2B0B2_9FLAO|nr:MULTISPECIES: hypothetical protein [Flavobacterium]TCN59023.1 hypothetical protein EV142_103472 [Flavobacterium circumlabens]